MNRSWFLMVQIVAFAYFVVLPTLVISGVERIVRRRKTAEYYATLACYALHDLMPIILEWLLKPVRAVSAQWESSRY
jgi:hypothetical protein